MLVGILIAQLVSIYFSLSFLSLRHSFVRLLDRGHFPNAVQLPLDLGIAIQLQLRIRELIHPRIEVRINSTEAAGQHALTATLAQLTLQHVKRPVSLRFVSRQRIRVLR